jgi:hypothetical protein
LAKKRNILDGNVAVLYFEHGSIFALPILRFLKCTEDCSILLQVALTSGLKNSNLLFAEPDCFSLKIVKYYLTIVILIPVLLIEGKFLKPEA